MAEFDFKINKGKSEDLDHGFCQRCGNHSMNLSDMSFCSNCEKHYDNNKPQNQKKYIKAGTREQVDL